jgi:Hsp70 protein
VVGSARLGIDFGTSHTVAVLQLDDRPPRPLLFDGSPQLSSGVFAGPAGELRTGRDAMHHARAAPERYTPNPKRHIDDETVLLGDAEPAVTEVIAAVLRRVHDEAVRVAGRALTDVVLTHPAAWGPRRREVLATAAGMAGLAGTARSRTGSAELAGGAGLALVPEPVAAARYFVDVGGATLPPGGCVVVYDFGAGTFDATVVRRVPDGFEVLASVGLPDAGGLDVDAALVAYVLAAHPTWDARVRERLDRPVTAADRRARGALWDDVRSAKEALSRSASTFVAVPLVEAEVPIGRDQFEQLARPILDRTVVATKAAVRDAGLAVAQINGVFLVGGSSRIPLVATLLHRAIGIAPTVLDSPELVVAEGAVRMGEGPPPPAVPVSTFPAHTAELPVLPSDPDWAELPPRPPARAGGRRRALVVAALLVVLLGGVGAAYAANRHATGTPRDTGTPRATGPGPAVTTTRPGIAYPETVAGTWTGTITQSDTRNWKIELRIAGGTPVAEVRYAGLGCSGNLNLIRVDGADLHAEEQITQGRDKCTVHGTVTLRLSDGKIAYWYQPDGAAYTATGLLTRSG